MSLFLTDIKGWWREPLAQLSATPVILIVLIAGTSQSESPSGEPIASPESICGPECVRVVLQEYHHSEPLYGLVREMQPTLLADGCDLATVARTLNARGLHTAAMQIGERVSVRWPYPVIVHLRANAGTGHFVVQLPDDSKRARVWFGPGDLRIMEQADFARWRSGAVLLTAPIPIDSPESSFFIESVGLPWTVLVLVVLLGCSLLLSLVIVCRKEFDR